MTGLRVRWWRVLGVVVLLTAGCNESGGSAESGDGSGPASASSAPSNSAVDLSCPPPTPVGLAEAAAALDCQTLPAMEGAMYVTKTPVGLHFAVPKGDVLKAIEFYRSTLTPLGWQPADDKTFWQTYPEGAAAPQGAQLFFFKQGQALYTSLGITPADGNLNAGLFHLGNLDARRLPQISAGTFVENTPARVTYESSAKPAEIRDFLRKELPKLGWREYRRPTPSGMPAAAMQNDQQLTFLQKAGKIDVYLMPKGDKTQVMTGVGLFAVEVPILADAAGIQFAEDPLVLMHGTPTKLEPALEFYRRELSTLGWTEREGKGSTTDSKVVRYFDAPNREPLTLEILQAENLTVVALMKLDDEQ